MCAPQHPLYVYPLERQLFFPLKTMVSFFFLETKSHIAQLALDPASPVLPTQGQDSSTGQTPELINHPQQTLPVLFLLRRGEGLWVLKLMFPSSSFSHVSQNISSLTALKILPSSCRRSPVEPQVKGYLRHSRLISRLNQSHFLTPSFCEWDANCAISESEGN